MLRTRSLGVAFAAALVLLAAPSVARAHVTISCSGYPNLDCSPCSGAVNGTCSSTNACDSGSFKGYNDVANNKRTGVKVCGHGSGTKTVTFTAGGGSASLNVSGTNCVSTHLDQLGGTLPTFSSLTTVSFSVDGCHHVSVLTSRTTDGSNYTIHHVSTCAHCACVEDWYRIYDCQCLFGSWSCSYLCVDPGAVTPCNPYCALGSTHFCYNDKGGCEDCTPMYNDSCCYCLEWPNVCF